MTSSMEPSNKTAGSSPAEAGEALRLVSRLNAAKEALEQAGKFARIGVIFGGLGWLLDWAIGSRIAVPGLDLGPDGWPPLAGPVLIVLLYSIFGAAYANLAVVVSRLVVSGRMQLVQAGSPSVVIRPAWWARAVRDVAIWFAVLLVGGASWAAIAYVKQSEAWQNTVTWGSVPSFIAWAAAMAVLAGSVMCVVDGAIWVVRRYVVPYVIASRVLWFVTCVAIGIAYTIVFAGLLIGCAFLARPLFVALGLGSTATLATVVPLVASAAWMGLDLARTDWDDRDVVRGDRDLPVIDLPSQSDFRNWDLDVETSYPPDDGRSAVDNNGYPYFLWRESADNRIGLSRPRYCCLTPHDGELYFTFFNPSGKVQPSGGLAIGLLVAALIAVTMLGGYWFTPRSYIPYHLDERPPPVLVVLNVALLAPLVGGVIGGIWHVLVLLLRWHWSRFAGDEMISALPLRELVAFEREDAEAVGSKVNGERAKSGKGLSAIFLGGKFMVLTGNAWEELTIRSYHQILTNKFVDRRDELVRAWDQRQKEVKRTSGEPDAHREPSPTPAPRRSGQGVPDQL